MDIEAVEKLVEIMRNARVSELTVSSGGSTIRLRKPLAGAPYAAPVRASAESKPQQPQPVSASETKSADAYITAPMVGMFHSMDNVSVGSDVYAGQVVGAIESMKLMNDVVSQLDGVIADVLVEDGSPVEYGQNLLKLVQTAGEEE